MRSIPSPSRLSDAALKALGLDGLTCAHFSRRHGRGEGFEPGEPVAHGDGPGRTFRGVPFPATKTSNDPACPGEGSGGMRVLLLGFPLCRCADR